MASRLTPEKIEEMFQAFSENTSTAYVMKISGISEKTVLKYRKQGKWDDRLAKKRKLAAKKADTIKANEDAKKIAALRFTQGYSASELQRAYKAKEKITPKDASKMLVDTIKMERELTGDDIQGAKIIIILPADFPPDADPRKYIESEVINGD